jgi:hypothetical protein
MKNVGSSITIKNREGKDVSFPLGDTLMESVWTEFSPHRTVASLGIQRYADEVLNVDFREVLDTILDGEALGDIKVSRFLTHTGLKPLFSPIVEDGLRLGLNRSSAQWEDLIARTVNVEGLAYEYYEFNNGTPANPGSDEFRLKRVGQGAPIPTARVTVSGKSFTLYKQGRGIEWTDEAKNAPIDLAAAWFEQVGLQLGWDYHDQIVDVLLNGYFADNSDDAPVLATATPGTITDADIYTAIATMQTVYGYTPSHMLMSLSRLVATVTMENGSGQRLFPNGLEAVAGLPAARIAPAVPNDKIVFVDSAFAVLRLVNKPFGTEFDRSVQTQVEGSYGSSIELFATLFPHARLILDA